MARACVVHRAVCALAFLSIAAAGAQTGEEGFVTRLSSPGKLEVVRHPPAADYSKFPNSGKIASLPSYRPNSQDNWQVDLRSCDLSALNVMDRLSDLLQADFDSKTAWPSQLPAGFDRLRIMEYGKNPGLGIRELHRLGITGAGVGIAVIDQALLVDHAEYRNRLKLYEEIHWQKDSQASMHGPAVASIAVGKTTGVAPEADLYYIAEWHARPKTGGGFEIELTPLAQAIDRIVEINRTLPPKRKIRVISISLGITSERERYDLARTAIANAEREGIYTIHTVSDPFMGLGRGPLADPDRFDSYVPGLFWASQWKNQTTFLMVPMDSRCTAAPNGENDYAFYRSGGMSWAVPWVAGLYALACQVRPDITPAAFWEAARKTSVAGRAALDGADAEFGHIINPRALLESLR